MEIASVFLNVFIEENKIALFLALYCLNFIILYW